MNAPNFKYYWHSTLPTSDKRASHRESMISTDSVWVVWLDCSFSRREARLTRTKSATFQIRLMVVKLMLRSSFWMANWPRVWMQRWRQGTGRNDIKSVQTSWRDWNPALITEFKSNEMSLNAQKKKEEQSFILFYPCCSGRWFAGSRRSPGSQECIPMWEWRIGLNFEAAGKGWQAVSLEFLETVSTPSFSKGEGTSSGALLPSEECKVFFHSKERESPRVIEHNMMKKKGKKKGLPSVFSR